MSNILVGRVKSSFILSLCSRVVKLAKKVTDCQKKNCLYRSYSTLIFYLFLLILHLFNRLSKNEFILYYTYILLILAYIPLAYTYLYSTYTSLYCNCLTDKKLERESQKIYHSSSRQLLCAGLAVFCSAQCPINTVVKFQLPNRPNLRVVCCFFGS